MSFYSINFIFRKVIKNSNVLADYKLGLFEAIKNEFVNYNTQDGLITNNFNKNSSYISDNGILYFGCYLF